MGASHELCCPCFESPVLAAMEGGPLEPLLPVLRSSEALPSGVQMRNRGSERAVTCSGTHRRSGQVESWVPSTHPDESEQDHPPTYPQLLFHTDTHTQHTPQSLRTTRWAPSPACRPQTSQRGGEPAGPTALAPSLLIRPSPLTAPLQLQPPNTPRCGHLLTAAAERKRSRPSKSQPADEATKLWPKKASEMGAVKTHSVR